MQFDTAAEETLSLFFIMISVVLVSVMFS